MSARLIHRSSARRMTRGWQAAALVVALAAGALWAFELPGLSVPAQGRQPLPSTLPPIATPQPEPPPPDADAVTGTAERLELARKPMPKAPPTNTEPTPPPAAAGLAWRYLGAIIEPTRKVALVSINGAQRMIAEGRTIRQEDHTLTLAEVHQDSIVVEDNGQRMVIHKDARSGPIVSWVSPIPGGAVVEGMNGAVSAAQAMNPEAMRARGMDPGEAERIREQIHSRRAAARAASGSAPTRPGGGRVVPPTLGTKAMRSGAANNASNKGTDTTGDAAAAEDGSIPRGPMP
ncbi:MAG: hypothetical protein IT437_00280 [Phycisphaerales bacterium]|nr:hypothetical protein [Phycisphaerales bacterium]